MGRSRRRASGTAIRRRAVVIGAYWLLDLPDVLSGAGCKVTLYSGWQTRSRSTGGLDAILGIVAHHTGGGGSEANAEDYGFVNADDKPIGNMYLRRDGTYVIGAAGAANTQGKGGPVTCSKGTVPLDQGNKYMIAVEAHNNGAGEVWPKTQMDAYFRGVAAMCRAYGLDPARDVFTHNGYCAPSCPGRKVDPAGPTPDYPTLGGTSGARTWPQNELRRLVIAQSSPTPPDPTPTPPGDDNMTPEQDAMLRAIYNALFVQNPVAPDTSIVHQVTQTHTIMGTFWDGHPGNIVDGPGVLARTIKNTAGKVGADIG